MPKHLRREIENLKKKILDLGAGIETVVHEAIRSIEERDAVLAQKIIDDDIEIDHTEVEIEEDCLKILALYQPVAIDLRFIVAILKINSDLERIGDLAVNIAERSVFLASVPQVNASLDFARMSKKTESMVNKCLDALVNMSSELANEVCADDDEVDAINRQMYLRIQEAIQEYPDQVPSLIHLLSVSRHLERIADHATNIAEDVVYMVEGRIVRHKAEEYK
ncbi:MAG: phosphate transport system regulatory protein PhoU [Planctomycetes bacterium RBG_19FT_COMBO_48_8]|nr:MAG: phosphate transport system regulatory protein PhoU [Planctomycetes bacterium RBG_19FT_COMBO_48_8]